MTQDLSFLQESMDRQNKQEIENAPMEIELNEQQQELIKSVMNDILDEANGLVWSNTTKSVASQILAKMEE